MVDELKRAARQGLDALVYHQEQTRPIHSTGEAIAALSKAIAEAIPEPLPEHVDHVPEIAARLRLVAKLAGVAEAIPLDDSVAVGCIFAVLGNMRRALERKQATPEPVGGAVRYVPGEWYEAKDRDDLEAFYRSRLPAIREAAREHGYAIGLHGSMRRDLDLIAAPWREGASDKDVLAHAIVMAACGITRDGTYQWEQKPLGRVAASLPCCWPSWFNEAGAGHIDLSVVAPIRPAAAPAVPEIDYTALIRAAFATNKKWAQGTNGCIAFKRGAEWLRDQIAAAQAKGGA